MNDLRAALSPSGIDLALIDAAAMEVIRPAPSLPNALPARSSPTHPDVLAVTASVGDRVVACGAASDESGRLRQIGVDVLAPWRGRGDGRAVVRTLTEAILERAAVPYYSHTISSLRSAALATSLFWPAWVQRHAQEQR